jgi:Mrp family chromosome partitioning ATPase
MRRLLPELESRADLVIIDTPAALSVSDPMPLLQMASGVVLVARMGRTTRDQVKRLQRVVGNVQGTIVGVVATAVGAGTGYEDYGYADYSTGDRRARWSLRRPFGRRRRENTTAEVRLAEASPGHPDPSTRVEYHDA